MKPSSLLSLLCSGLWIPALVLPPVVEQMLSPALIRYIHIIQAADETQSWLQATRFNLYLSNLVVYYLSSIVLWRVQCDGRMGNLEVKQWGLFLPLMNAKVYILCVFVKWKSGVWDMCLSVLWEWYHWSWISYLSLLLAAGWYGTSGRDGPSRT